MTDRFDRAGEAFAQLCRTMATLRAPGGCAWDREQTLTSLKPYLVEETYEVIDAMEAGDPAAHRDELGDLLLQVVFQAEIAQETAAFDAAAVAQSIDAKLRRRHPHVFAGAHAGDAAAALQQWERIKAGERPRDQGRLSGVPRALPGLLRAWRTGEKAAAVGFDWPDATGSWAKLDEELAELRAACTEDPRSAAARGEMGDVLFAVVNLCRHLKMDPEEALRQTIDKFHRRFAHIERRLREAGEDVQQAPLSRLNDLWEEAKGQPAS